VTITSSGAPDRARARVLDSARLPACAIAGSIAAMGRRAAGVKRRPGWSARLEAMISAYRGTWSQLPAMGIVRWRNVGEALSAYRTDGLTPRWIRQEHEAGAIAGAWLEPADAAADGPVLLYFHGGGFCFGSLRTHGPLIAGLARAARARTFALEYRLAPEHPRPAAMDDAIAAYRLLLADKIAPSRIVLAGDSAGGTIVLSLLLALRDGAGPLPAAGVAISPWVDLGCSGESFVTNATFDFVGLTQCLMAADAYLGDVDRSRPDISPLFADLRGLPPLLVHGGEAEVLIDQIRAFIARAQAAGVDVRPSIYPDMVHVWHLMTGATPQAQRAIDEVAAFVRAQVR
jgi:epsilon-lactone hydrolase